MEKMARKMGTKSVCQKVGISVRQLEYWVLIGVVKPKTEPHGTKSFKKYSEEDIYFLKRVKILTDEGVLVSRAAEKLKRSHGAGL